MQVVNLLDNIKQQVEVTPKHEKTNRQTKKSLDKNKDGKLSKEDFLLVRKLRNKKKNGKANS